MASSVALCVCQVDAYKVVLVYREESNQAPHPCNLTMHTHTHTRARIDGFFYLFQAKQMKYNKYPGSGESAIWLVFTSIISTMRANRKIEMNGTQQRKTIR